MKLIYNILWVDNEKGIYENHKDDIFEYLEELGFEAKIKFLDDYQSFIDANLNLEDYDLFILDYKLKLGQDGNEIVEIIREDNYTEILFYSTVPEEARKKIFDDKSNGIYITSRNFDEFEEDILGLINITIKKVQDVNNLRGLIMAEVSELDRIKERIIIKYAKKNKCGTLEKYIIKTLKKSYDDNTKDVMKYTDSPIDEIIEKLYVDSDKKARTVKKVKNSFSEVEYRNNILRIRNKFAHVEEKDNMVDDIEFTEKNCIKIRKDIREYKDILIGIENEI